MTGLRRKARIFALQVLYEIDCSGHPLNEVIANLLKEHIVKPEAISFCTYIIEGVLDNRPTLDKAIQEFAPLFPTKQLATIDRNILRIAIFEILFDNKVPVKVAVNEAIELAKSFGSDKSSKFINGVLGSLISKRELMNLETRIIKQDNSSANA